MNQERRLPSNSINGLRHQGSISAADQMPAEQEAADTRLSPMTHRALSIKGLLCYKQTHVSVFCPLKEKGEAGICACCSPARASGSLDAYTLSARMLSSTNTEWKATKYPMARLGSGTISLCQLERAASGLQASISPSMKKQRAKPHRSKSQMENTCRKDFPSVTRALCTRYDQGSGWELFRAQTICAGG